jgi:hypothetical protein
MRRAIERRGSLPYGWMIEAGCVDVGIVDFDVSEMPLTRARLAAIDVFITIFVGPGCFMRDVVLDQIGRVGSDYIPDLSAAAGVRKL